MSGIKVETQFKGKWHYEEYLLKNHRKKRDLHLPTFNELSKTSKKVD
jgi:hypothetical protein